MKRYLQLLLAVLAIASIAGVGAGAAGVADKVDEAFVGVMPMHHEMAIEMAKMAREQGEHGKIRSLAGDIIKAQTAEIRQFGKIADGLGMMAAGMDGHMAMMDDLSVLGLTMKQSGMDMDMNMLDGAKPFDRMFIDMMVPHHQGAIRMARVELKRGKDPLLLAIARAIVKAQAREIREMNQWRVAWYGAPSPAGGVPRS
ncbi:MAG TPA: DUF305 domain-containing protein [Solirubrobacterales bacterium]